MVFYLDHGRKFHLYNGTTDVILVQYDESIHAPQVRSCRWQPKLPWLNDHMDKIIKHLKSDCDEDKELGVTMLEQTLKIRIDGRIVGFDEGTSI